MRIVWLSHFVPYPPRGGNVQRSHHLLRQAAAHHEVHLVALNQRAMLPTPDAVERACASLRGVVASLSVFPIPADRSRLAWYRLALRAFGDRRPYDVLWLRQPAMHTAIQALLGSRAGVDLVHVDTLGLWQYLPAGINAVTVLNHHNVESQLTARRAALESHSLRRLYLARDAAKLRRTEEDCAAAASLNLVVSSLDGERLREVAPNAAIAVVENGVDTEYFRPADHDGAPGHLLFVGSMGWYPNAAAATYLVRDIWPVLVRQDPQLRLTLVGPSPPPSLRKAAATDPRICVTGFVDDVRPYFAGAQIYLCPIQDGGGTRLKVLDALAMGRPVVATSLAVEGLGLEPGIHFLPAETPQQFAQQVARLRSTAQLRADLATAGRHVVESRFSWSVIGHHLRRAYAGALATATGHATSQAVTLR